MLTKRTAALALTFVLGFTLGVGVTFVFCRSTDSTKPAVTFSGGYS